MAELSPSPVLARQGDSRAELMAVFRLQKETPPPQLDMEAIPLLLCRASQCLQLSVHSLLDQHDVPDAPVLHQGEAPLVSSITKGPDPPVKAAP